MHMHSGIFTRAQTPLTSMKCIIGCYECSILFVWEQTNRRIRFLLFLAIRTLSVLNGQLEVHNHLSFFCHRFCHLRPIRARAEGQQQSEPNDTMLLFIAIGLWTKFSKHTWLRLFQLLLRMLCTFHIPFFHFE